MRIELNGRFAVQTLAAILLALFLAGCGATPAQVDPSPTPAPTAATAATPSPITDPTVTPPAAPDPTATTAPAATPTFAPTATATASSAGDGALTVHFFDVGQGDATLLQGPDFTILIDAGTHDQNDVVPNLQSAGIASIDLLVGTHPHADHIGQFPQVLEAFPVAEVWLSGHAHTTLTFERAIAATSESDPGYRQIRTREAFEFGSACAEGRSSPKAGKAHRTTGLGF